MAAEKAGRGFWLGLAAVLVAALALRVVGGGHGLPFVYNADENAHFVPRAIGMFGHSYNPGYFINPPAFTYLVHALLAVLQGGREAVGEAFATDPGEAFRIGRTASAVLGTIAVGLLCWAGARLFDRRVGLLAAALLALAFLPVHYAHFALNDVPALAPLCLALAGAAGIWRAGRTADFALAGVGLGLTAATKYTGGIVVLCIAAAAVLGPAPGRRVLVGAVLVGVLALGAFLVANPYALLDLDAFKEGLTKQSSASNDGGGKLGLTQENGLLYYLSTLTWGLGWLPLAAALGAAVALVVRRDGRAWVLLPAIVVFLLFMGTQDRFFARWLLPVYPLLCLLAAWGALEAATFVQGRIPEVKARAALPIVAAVLLCLQGAVYATHNAIVLSRDDTRQQLRDWLKANLPADRKVVLEPIAPDQWATDPGDPRPAGNGAFVNKWPTSRSRYLNDGRVVAGGKSRRVKLEDYERVLRPELVDSYARGGYCTVIVGSTQFGRALAEPGEVPRALAYYRELERRSTVVRRFSPQRDGGPAPRFSFDDSFNARRLSVARPGPEIRVHRLRGGDC